MKKSLQLACAAVLFSTASFAQIVSPGTLPGKPTNVSRTGAAVQTETKSATLGCTDKVTYVDNNGTGNPNADYVKLGGSNGWEGTFQVFTSFTGQITRVDFKAGSYTGTETVQASIHAIDVWDQPIGSPLGSVNVNVGTTIGEYGAAFATPVNVTAGFAVVIWSINPADSIKVMLNSDGSGQNTGYSHVFGGLGLLNLLSDYSLDMDFLFRPTIKFDSRTVFLSASPTTLCAGNNVNFNYTFSTSTNYGHPQFNPNGTMLSLNYGDATPAGTTLPVNHTYTNAGSYTATLIETYDGWSSNCVSDPATQTITVNPGVNSFFNWSANQLAVTFTNLCTGASTFAWQFGDAGTAAAPNPVHNYAASGTYTVELTATGTCGSDFYSTNITITDSTSGGNVGIQNIENELLVNLYPNPVNDVFTLQIESSLTDAIQVDVLSPLGQVISSRNLGVASQSATAFDMSAYAAGVYFVRISQGNSHMVKPFMKN